jgi:hypothetical protein
MWGFVRVSAFVCACHLGGLCSCAQHMWRWVLLWCLEYMGQYAHMCCQNQGLVSTSFGGMCTAVVAQAGSRYLPWNLYA